MSRRSLVPGILLVLLASLVAWVAWSVRSEPLAIDAADAEMNGQSSRSAERADPLTLAHASNEANPPDASPDVAAADSSAKRAAITASEAFADAVWVEGRVEFPPDTPRDERAFVVTLGPKLAGESRHNFDVGPDGRFRAAFSPLAKKGWLHAEGRYLYSLELLAIEPGSPPSPIVLTPLLGGVLRAKLVPSDLAAPRRAEFARAKATAQGWSTTSGEFQQRSARADDQHVLEFRALAPSADWNIHVELDGFSAVSPDPFTIDSGRVTEIELVLKIGARLAGVVVDEAGAPIARAGLDVVETSEEWGWAYGEHKSDAAGRFDFTTIEFGQQRLRTKAEGYTGADAGPFELTEGFERTDLVITLSRGGAIAGRVLWPDRQPAEGATVQIALEVDAQAQPDFLNTTSATVRTAADGSFEVRGLAMRAFSVTARARKRDETGSQRLDWTARTEAVAPGTTGLELVLGPGDVVRGIVVDDLGAPVCSIPVRADPGDFRVHRVQNARTDRKSGRFELPSVGEGSWTVTAGQRNGRESSSEQIEMPRDAGRELRLVLPRPVVLAGVVLGPDGAPAERAALQIEHGEFNTGSMDGRRARTDEKGRFELTRVTAGSFALTAVGLQGAPSESLQLELLPGERREGLVLQLRRGGTIEGRVLDGEGRPLRGASVTTWGPTGDTRSTGTAPDGTFRIEHAHPGTNTVSANHPTTPLADHLSTKSVEIVEGELVRVELGGSEPGSLRVTGVVRAGTASTAATLRWTLRGGAAGSRDTESDEAGSYSVVLPAAGEYHVWITTGTDAGNASIQRMVDVAAAGGRIDFELPSCAVEGRVLTPNGQPIANARVEIKPLDARPAESEATTYARAECDERGRFRIENLTPGEYSAAAEPPWNRPVESEPVYAPGESVQFRLAEGEQRRGLMLRLAQAGSVAGVVYLPDGRLASSARVECADGRDLSANCDPAGRFRFDVLATGSVTFSARAAGGFVSQPVQASVRAGETTEVRLDLVAGGRLAVQLQDANGAPLRSVDALNVFDSTGAEVSADRYQWSSDPADYAELTPLLPGEYTARAMFGEQTVEARATVVAGGLATVTLRAPK